jgi:peptidoglycan/xylan/chitin deacetylase (PgdA/CDA1 family)
MLRSFLGFLHFLLLSISICFLASCQGPAAESNVVAKDSLRNVVRQLRTDSSTVPGLADSIDSSEAAVLARLQVPVLCYHQIRDFRASDSRRSRDYIVPPQHFREQMKMLKDSGYEAILPDQLMDYLLSGQGLPARPVVLSFDDADLSQFDVAKPVLDQYGFKGIFFIMTVVLNKPGYMSREQVRQLSDEGHVIGSHTWDHMNVKKLAPEDWAIQIDKPSRQLSEITGKRVEYFAYPFGLWDRRAAAGIRDRGFRAAFQLSARRDSTLPLYSIRRIIIPGEWPAEQVYRFMKRSFL